MTDLRTRYTRTADGVNIAYGILGEGAPVVSVSSVWGDLHLYQHFPNMRTLFDSVAATGLQLVLYDSRGMGASDHDNKDLTIDARVRDLEAVLDATGNTQAPLVSVVGGAPIAIALAGAQPERVKSMVLINGFALGADWYALVPAMQVTHKLREMAASEWELYTLTMASAVMQFGNAEGTQALAAAMRSSTTPGVYLDWMTETAAIDVRESLKQVQAPTLVVFMGALLPGARSLSQELAAGIPNAEFVELAPGPEAAEIIGSFLAGREVNYPGLPADTPFRAVLFTDLVGHTEMMRRLGDEKGREVLREHETITRDVLKQHGGSEVKTMGDGFMASFPSVTRGVECALALRAAFAERNARADEPLRVRVGLNAGEPIEEDGDLFGETVILAARIAAMAEGGEVLGSMAVRELCAGKGFLFADMGEQMMRGFEDPVRVFQIKEKT